AAISSSGLVPAAFSKRVPNEYCVFDKAPLSVEIVPRPDLRSPFHMADALRFMMPPLDRWSAARRDDAGRRGNPRRPARPLPRGGARPAARRYRLRAT